MKILLLTATALTMVAAASLSPAMANRFGPFDTRLTDDSDRLGQNGINAATTTPDGRHYQWQIPLRASGMGGALGSRQLKGD
jgi:hypothetical protein